MQQAQAGFPRNLLEEGKQSEFYKVIRVDARRSQSRGHSETSTRTASELHSGASFPGRAGTTGRRDCTLRPVLQTCPTLPLSDFNQRNRCNQTVWAAQFPSGEPFCSQRVRVLGEEFAADLPGTLFTPEQDRTPAQRLPGSLPSHR